MSKRIPSERHRHGEPLPLGRALFAVVGLSMALGANAAGDARHGKVLAQTCVGCHGVSNYDNVYPTFHVPKLGGQSAEYIAAALAAYQSGARTHETMRANAASLSNQDVADIAAYFSSLPPPAAKP